MPCINAKDISEILFNNGFVDSLEEGLEEADKYNQRRAQKIIQSEFQKAKSFDKFNRQSNAKQIDVKQVGLKKYFFISFNVFGDNVQGETVNYFGNKVIDNDPMNWQFQNQFKKIGLQIILLSWNQISKEQFDKYQKLFLSDI